MDNTNLCKICTVKNAIYACPRCNLPYCSVDCYKATPHSNCSEAFYREWIEQEIRDRETDPEARKKMLDILRRVNDEDFEEDLDSDDEEDSLDLSDRLAGVDLDDSDAVWERLTKEERQQFSELMTNGDVTGLLPPWQPWWAERHPRPKVRFLEDTSPLDPFKKDCPRIPRNIPSLSSLSKTKPSVTVRANIANVLGGYALTARYYNGEHINFPVESSSVLLRVSRNLTFGQIYETLDSALASVHQEALVLPSLKLSSEFVKIMQEDVLKIIEGPNDEEKNFYVVAALSDINKLLAVAKKCEKSKSSSRVGSFHKVFSDHTDDTVPRPTKQELSKVIKKIEYYMSWATEYWDSL
ncbi:hypothetical protein AAG570_008770 [Ranatra chinensis]|uniref:HIT-type domain-containing protein n=1 Tax=Ranatra chinensis TaxID=642074 RepID=A0ABD0YRU4_9HEMI